MYHIERVCVNIPGQGKAIIDAQVNPSDDDRDIAIRLAKGFPIGTTFHLAGAKWRSISKDPPNVEEITGSDTVPAPRSLEPVAASAGPLPTPAPTPAPATSALSALPRPGEVWKPRDPRRIAAFKVQEVTATDVIADDGRRVSLDRWRRYVRV